jgi:hypothetical protein
MSDESYSSSDDSELEYDSDEEGGVKLRTQPNYFILYRVLLSEQYTVSNSIEFLGLYVFRQPGSRKRYLFFQPCHWPVFDIICRELNMTKRGRFEDALRILVTLKRLDVSRFVIRAEQRDRRRQQRCCEQRRAWFAGIDDDYVRYREREDDRDDQDRVREFLEECRREQLGVLVLKEGKNE